MGVIYLLIPLALGIVLAAVVTFWWAVRNGQLDDLDTPAMRMLFDDGLPQPSAHARTSSGENA